MIFVTVGHQMPFDRLISAVDEWAEKAGRDDILAQIGKAEYKPGFIRNVEKIDPIEFNRIIENADAIISHAGTGTILTALYFGIPILIMPRRAALMETRNDHQVATAKHFKAFTGVEVAMDESELPAMMDRLNDIKSETQISQFASDELVAAIRAFCENK